MRAKSPSLNSKFYISRRSKNIHMGLDHGLLSISNYQLVIFDITNTGYLEIEILKQNLLIQLLYILPNGNSII